MVFRKGGSLSRREKWFYEGNQIQVANSYCYLGYTFTTMLSAKLGTSHLAAKGKKAVYILCKAFQKCKEMTHNTIFTIFQSKVQSILLCSSELWGLQILKVQKKYIIMLAYTRFLGVHIGTSNTLIYGELARYLFCVNS